MNFRLIFDLIDEHFSYLIDGYGFSIVSKKLYDSSDYAKIVLQSKECRIRVLRERGEIFVDAGPLSAVEEWYDLATLIAYLTKETEQFEYKIPDYGDYDARVEWQLERLAAILQRYYTEICELFRRGTFDEKRADLKEFINLRAKNG